MRTDSPTAALALAQELSDVLIREADLLDNRRYTEWSELLTDDFRYIVPIPVTRDNQERGPWELDSFALEEDRTSISLWVRRNLPEHFQWAWGENPPLRVRHFISNVFAQPVDGAPDVEVRCNFLVSFTRQSRATQLLAGGRIDRWTRVDDGWKLRARVSRLDQSIIDVTHLRVIL